MSGPIVRIDGSEEIQDSGTTLGDLRETYPGCYLVNGNNAHRSSAFVLENGVTYDLKLLSSGSAVGVSPRPNAVFVLVVQKSSSVNSSVEILGTAFALECPNRNVAMTTAHCIYRENAETAQKEKVVGTLFLASKVRRSAVDGLIYISNESGVQRFKVSPFYHNSMDMALMMIQYDPSNTNSTFSERIPLCPPTRMPSGQSYEVRVIQCPATVFYHMHLQVLQPDFGDWAQTRMVQDDHFFVASMAGPGSSGGPAINRYGEVVGMVQTGVLPSMSVTFEEVDDDSVSQWTGAVSASGQISNYIKIVLVKTEHHPSFPSLLGNH